MTEKTNKPLGGWRRWSLAAVMILATVSAYLVAGSGFANAADTFTLEAEQMSQPVSSKVIADSAASNGKAVLMWANGTASGSFVGPASKVTIRARGDQCKGAPRMVILMDGKRVAWQSVDSSSWSNYAFDLSTGSGTHNLKVRFTNDYYRSSTCDRNLLLDKTDFIGSTPATPVTTAPHFGLIGNDTTHLTEEREAGIEAKLFSLSWRRFYPQEGVKDTAYIAAKKQELQRLREAGFKVILSFGYHDTPPWVHQNYPDSYYVDQYGERWTGDTFTSGHPMDNGEANLVFNRQLRGLVASYMKDVTTEFGNDLYAVRLGGGRYGELTYPPTNWNGKTNRYWAYDQNALASSPVPNWGPGNPSPNGEASRFLEWYLGALVEYQNWQISALRATGYDGRIMMLYPSWGLRPGQIEKAVATNLDGSTSAERNGEVQRGYDFARQIAAITDPKVMVTTTWLDAPTAWSGPGNPTPVEYLSTLARQNPHNLQTYGENTGHGDRTEMEFTASQMRRYGLVGMLWYNEQELFSGRYATLEDYRREIDAHRESEGAR